MINNTFSFKLKKGGVENLISNWLLYFLLLYFIIALLLWYYSGFIKHMDHDIICHDLLNLCKEVYQDSWPLAPRPQKVTEDLGSYLQKYLA